ncbi:MAG TPA: gamma-glutamylcyclotransferase [Methylomusa anaerophila]|uniref:AIG2-like family protein n=1 Tax=Methylomusa anaerophila TaxID=1930071 RepID=A0A348AGF7_9FIRM|nr:gamma-glutamylcyclotransferase family protein [Methylomusa anaerophila]BBB90155.1 AIG2-like family protein [Methylomusa anaerophila]HML88119.1 gamma-glutamylcyclotransferase [Methylomusa anaerophila]
MSQDNESRQPFLYFAYGSNLNPAQMRQRCPRHRVVGIARLPGYRLGFYGHSTKWDGGVETIIPQPQSEVWGVLYQLDAFEWRQLDSYQDAKDNGRGEYFHFPVEVMDEEQSVRTAITYKKDMLDKAERPSTEYLGIIVQGAQEHGLPANYVAELRHIPTRPALYAVPRKQGPDRMSDGGCSGCGD